MIAIHADHSGSTGRQILNGILDYVLHHPVPRWKIITLPWRHDFHQPNDAFPIQEIPIQGLITHVWRTPREYQDKQNILDARLPTVLAATAPIPDIDAPSVLVDDVAIGKAAADYFLARGYRNFAFAAALLPGISFDNRLAGFAETLLEKGLTLSVFGGHPCKIPPPIRPAPGDMIDWLRNLPKPAAVFCAKDSIANLVHTAANAAKISVPDQLSILGVDDDAAFHYESVGISSVAPPFRQVGYRSAQLLNDLLDGITPPPITRVASCEIITRTTTNAIALRDTDVLDAVRYIRDNACEGITVEHLLHKIPLSRRTLERRFQSALGLTPKEEIQRVRVEHAKLLLAKTNLTIPEIALATGFSHRSRLFEAFKSQTTLSPQEYRSTHQPDSSHHP